MTSEPCRVACGACCHDAGRPCFHLTPTGCRWPRGSRPPGCEAYLCGIARAVADGVLDVAYGAWLRAWEAEAERLKLDTAGWKPPTEET